MNLLFRKSGSSGMKWLNVVWFIISVSCLIYFSSKLLFAGDPSGEDTFSDSIEGLKYSINFTWTLVAAFLVFSMQGGFVLLGGFLQSKNMLGYMCCRVPGIFDARGFCIAWRIPAIQKHAGLYGTLCCRWFCWCTSFLDVRFCRYVWRLYGRTGSGVW